MLNVSVKVRERSGRKKNYAPPAVEQNCFEALWRGLVRPIATEVALQEKR